MKLKGLLKKVLYLVPDFPGIAHRPSQFELVDLKQSPAITPKKRYLKPIFLMLAVLFSALVLWVNLMLSHQENEVVKIRTQPQPVMKASSTPSEVKTETPKTSYTILMLGKEDDGRADTIILCHMQIDTGTIRILSFPRDTRVLTAHKGTLVMDKVSHAFRWGGLELLTHSIQEFLRIPVDHTVVIDLVIFRKIIDAIGGVEVDVEKDLKYTDKAQGLTININKGLQVLNGENAEGYVRYRSDGLGDLGRIERQKKFIAAFLTRVKSLKTIGWESLKVLGRMPGFILDLYKDVDTTIPVELFVKLLMAFGDMDREKIAFRTMAGAGEYIPVPQYKKKINFFMSSEADVHESRNWILNGYDINFEQLDQTEYFSRFKPLTDSIPSMESITSVDSVSTESSPPRT